MTTEWRPDTCACVMQYDEIQGESGVPIWTYFESCGVHPNATAAYNTNRQKNEEMEEVSHHLGKEQHELLENMRFKMNDEGGIDWEFQGLSIEDELKAKLAISNKRERT